MRRVGQSTVDAARRLAGRCRSLGFWMALLVVAFAVLAVGPPLWGHGVFASTDMLIGPRHTMWLSDTIDAAIPQSDLFGAGVRAGRWLNWNPYILGGVPLGATSSLAVASPLSLPFWLLPGWLAPAWMKLLEIGCSVGGCYLYLRRLRLERPAALLGGLVFASSAFMIFWTNWPQTRVAAFIPALFWAVERLLQRRRVLDVALIALVVAAMLLGGFPAVTGYAIYTAAAYLLVRSVAQWRHRLVRAAGFVGVLAGGLAGLLLGVALAAWQLVPFSVFMGSAHVAGREQSAGAVLPPVSLLTSIAPWALGTGNATNPPVFFFTKTVALNNSNLVETSVYVGAAALVLAVLAATRARRAARLLPPAILPFLLGAVAFWLAACFLAGPRGVLVQLPVFDTNFVGRSRSVLGFLVAVLAAVGYQLVAAPPDRASRRVRWWHRVPAGLVWLGLAVGVYVLWQLGRYTARHSVLTGNVSRRLTNLDRQLLIALALVAVALLLIAVARLGGRRGRTAALVLLPLLIVGQALSVTTPYFPRSPRASYYPQTDLTRFLAAHLGEDRMAEGWGMRMGVETAYRLRALDGHSYADARMVDLLQAVPGFTVVNNTTLVFSPLVAQATSPVLDRLGVRYFVTPSFAGAFGRVQPAPPGVGSAALRPGQVLRVPVPGGGPLRGVSLTVTGTLATTLTVTLRDPAGRAVASSSRALGVLSLDANPAESTVVRPALPVTVPIAGEDLPGAQPLTAEITASAPVLIATAATGLPALGVVRPAPDGLRLVFAGSAVAYQRLTALPRIRWASRAVTVPDSAAQVAAVAGGRTPADTVILSAAAAPGQGLPATVAVAADRGDSLRIDVRAQGAGYLVVADALLTGWRATVDGQPVELLAADHAVTAVRVPAGTHTVDLSYTPPAGNAGAWISLGALLVLLLICLLTCIASTRSRLHDRRARLSKEIRHVHDDPAGDDVRRTVPAAGGAAAARRDRGTALLQRRGPHPGRDRADHPRPGPQRPEL